VILVIGGTSRLGAILVPALVAEGHRVRVLTRDSARANHLPADVTRTIGDARDPAALSAAVTGCTTVISSMHGFVGDRGISPESVDRDANLALIRAASDGSVQHFVLVSAQGARADHPMSLHRAKFAAEVALRTSGLPFTIIRPTSFLETWMSVIGDAIDTSGVALVFGPGRNPINFVSVRDVGALIALAIRDPALRGQTIDIGGPANLDFTTFADQLIAASGKPARIKRIPLPVLRAMSVVARPFSPQFARKAGAAVVMNRDDLTFTSDLRVRFPSVPNTTLEDLLAPRIQQ
jgi:uncharacterized protein YbjT (DUF2867 family)